ncbi:MAG TPA: MATE family efflux transporter [Vitreimonas sp.]|uniref:MATE family efflux transporter n=1 Tax=Vitreimonas sp. TaxID=3069702 RepID=UPI002D749EF8|nr:MATE family efflux transporter [Vitreimonas sp.]HYD87672.1 MATE family efflux transporter [Vitreimonas sp.]
MSQTAAAAQRKPQARMDLTEGPIARTLIMFSLPVLGTSVLQSINGSINAVWVGRLLGPEALAATTNATLILLFLLGVLFGVGMAATILVGQAVGAKDLPRAKQAVGTGISFFLLMSLALAIGGYAASGQILALMGTPADVRPLAEDYLRMVFLSMPFMSVFAFMVMAQRGAGDARTPFFFNTLATLLDVALNPLLISGLGPFPELGIAGSGLSLLLSQATGLSAMLAYLYWRKSDLRLAWRELHLLNPDGAILRTMVFKGLPMGAQMLVISASGLVMMSMINAHGAETAAAYGVAFQLWAYLQMPAMAIGAAASSMAAQNVGAGKWERVEKSALAGVLINVALTGSLVALLYLVDPLLVGLFLPAQPVAIAIAEHINTIAGWSFILFGVTFVLFGVVRATGAVTPPLIILVVSLIGVRIGFAALLQPAWGADAIWWSFPASMAASAALAGAYYRWGGWRTAKMA